MGARDKSSRKVKNIRIIDIVHAPWLLMYDSRRNETVSRTIETGGIIIDIFTCALDEREGVRNATLSLCLMAPLNLYCYASICLTRNNHGGTATLTAHASNWLMGAPRPNERGNPRGTYS